MKKLFSLNKLLPIIEREKKRKKKIVFTNGCFDLLHIGHIRYLKKAKTLGDILILGLNTDSSVQKLKGNSRPILPEKERAEILDALEMIDYIVFFKEETPFNLISKIKPDILVKGADYKGKEVVGRDVVEENGGKVVLIQFEKGKSTSQLINKIRNIK
ncbi:MAG: D-glycero-beta-D-manno-heptose 1-phosphate adenylyltransferase [bacterium]|nr:D-glycero-beta-D-manno-heptose 1-phosphate adenylyltransferase [bacterium]